MKKTILSLITVMVLGTTVSYASNTCQDDKTQKKEQCDGKCDMQKGHHDGERMGGPRRPPMGGPRIQATDGCKCATCEQIRKMEQEMQQHMKEHKDKKCEQCKCEQGKCEQGKCEQGKCEQGKCEQGKCKK